MTEPTRQPLTIDDPVAGRDACHVAHPSGPGRPDGRLKDLRVEDIHPNPDQPRKHFDEEALRSLADSIRERGVLQPIIVRPHATGGYQLIAGERRWRAAQLGGRASIPALIDMNVQGAGSLELALIENVVREDLTVIEPRGIALDASFDRLDDAITSGFGAIRGLTVGVG
jgi:ParB/RepB/Spo0J family partition protein